MAEIAAKNTFGMPRQKLTESDKTEDWGKQCVDAIINMSGQLLYNGRSTQYHKQVNYDLVNGIFNEDDMKYVTDPYNIAKDLGNQPANMVCYPVIPSKLNLLDGEELKRPFNFQAICTGGEGSQARQDKKMQMILEFYKNKLYKELGITPEQAQAPDFQTPEQISKWVDTNYQDMREIMANHILKYLKFEQDLKMKFNKGFRHSKICAEEIYYVGKSAGKPVVRVVNPLYFDFDRNPEIEFIEDSQWAKEERYMAIGEIIDEFAEYLTDEQIDMIESGNFGFGFSNQQAMASATMTYIPYDNNHPRRTEFLSRHSGIPVNTVVWKGMRKIGFLTYTDEHGEEQQTMVKDDFKLSPALKSAGATLDWEWKTEIWQGVRIGADIYINIEPLPNQVNDKLPYVGGIYNNLNSIATSLVDYMKPHQYLYNIVWYRLELELAKAKGKKFIMDMAQLPKSQGWDEDKWMYYFDNLGVAWINSLEEGSEQLAGKVAQFNQFQSVDMTLSQSVQQYINILNKLEDMIGELVGVTRQREGQISTSETVGGTERSIVQSSMITEPLFIKHNQIKQRVITHLLEVAKLCYSDGGKVEFLDEDLLRSVLEIDGDLLNDSEYGIFVTDATTEQAVFDKLQGIAQQALQAQAITLSELITVFKSNSLAEVEHVIKTGEARREAQAGQQQNAEQQHEIQVAQLAEQAKDKERAWQSSENQKDRDSRIEEAEIKALGFSKETDANGNNIPDVVEQADIILKQREQEHKQSIDRQKATDDAIDKARKSQLEAKKLELDKQKLDRDDANAERERQHDAHRIALEKEKHDMDLRIKEKELEQKEKDRQLKEQEAKQKARENAQKLEENNQKLHEKALDIHKKKVEHKAKIVESQHKILESKQKIQESKAKADEVKKKAQAQVYKMKNTPAPSKKKPKK